MALTQQERIDKINDYREGANKVLAAIGYELPAPKVGQTYGGYRRSSVQTVADSFVPQTHELSKPDYRNMDFESFKALEPQVFKAAIAETLRNEGPLRMIVVKDLNGHEIRKFYGDSFVKQFTRPGRRVASFRTMHGPVGANGLFLR
jgi:hypothetical protein